jgi:hypothetical protein
MECGHTFEVFGVESELDGTAEVECPLCGSEDCTRTYDDGAEMHGEEWDKADGGDDDTSINLDDE